jgi:hypothetical protein
VALSVGTGCRGRTAAFERHIKFTTTRAGIPSAPADLASAAELRLILTISHVAKALAFVSKSIWAETFVVSSDACPSQPRIVLMSTPARKRCVAVVCRLCRPLHRRYCVYGIQARTRAAPPFLLRRPGPRGGSNLALSDRFLNGDIDPFRDDK